MGITPESELIQTLYDKIQENFGRGTQMLCLQMPPQNLNPAEYAFNTESALSIADKPMIVRDAEFRLSDKMFNPSPIVTGPNGSSLSTTWQMLLENYVADLENTAKTIENRNTVKRYLMETIEAEVLVFDLDTESFSTKEIKGPRSLVSSEIYRTYLAKKNEWEQYKREKLTEARKSEHEDFGTAVNEYYHWVSSYGLFMEEYVETYYQDSIVRGDYFEVQAALSFLDHGSIAVVLEQLKRKFRESRAHSYSNGSEIFPVRFMPSNWHEYLLVEPSPSTLLNSLDAKQARVQRLENIRDTYTMQLVNIQEQRESAGDLDEIKQQQETAQQDVTTAFNEIVDLSSQQLASTIDNTIKGLTNTVKMAAQYATLPGSEIFSTVMKDLKEKGIPINLPKDKITAFTNSLSTMTKARHSLTEKSMRAAELEAKRSTAESITSKKQEKLLKDKLANVQTELDRLKGELSQTGNAKSQIKQSLHNALKDGLKTPSGKPVAGLKNRQEIESEVSEVLTHNVEAAAEAAGIKAAFNLPLLSAFANAEATDSNPAKPIIELSQTWKKDIDKGDGEKTLTIKAFLDQLSDKMRETKNTIQPSINAIKALTDIPESDAKGYLNTINKILPGTTLYKSDSDIIQDAFDQITKRAPKPESSDSLDESTPIIKYLEPDPEASKRFIKAPSKNALFTLPNDFPKALYEDPEKIKALLKVAKPIIVQDAESKIKKINNTIIENIINEAKKDVQFKDIGIPENAKKGIAMILLANPTLAEGDAKAITPTSFKSAAFRENLKKHEILISKNQDNSIVKDINDIFTEMLEKMSDLHKNNVESSKFTGTNISNTAEFKTVEFKLDSLVGAKPGLIKLSYYKHILNLYIEFILPHNNDLKSNTIDYGLIKQLDKDNGKYYFYLICEHWDNLLSSSAKDYLIKQKDESYRKINAQTSKKLASLYDKFVPDIGKVQRPSDGNFIEIAFEHKFKKESSGWSKTEGDTKKTVTNNYWLWSCATTTKTPFSSSKSASESTSKTVKVTMKVAKVSIDRGGWFRPDIMQFSKSLQHIDDISASEGKTYDNIKEIVANEIKGADKIDPEKLKQTIDNALLQGDFGSMPFYLEGFLIAKDLKVLVTHNNTKKSDEGGKSTDNDSKNSGSFWHNTDETTVSTTQWNEKSESGDFVCEQMMFKEAAIIGWYLQPVAKDHSQPYTAEFSDSVLKMFQKFGD